MSVSSFLSNARMDNPFDIYNDPKVIDFICKIFDNEKVKTKLSQRIRIEMDNYRNKTSGNRLDYKNQSYDSYTSGSVDYQAKMAASGYDIYGKTIISSNRNLNNTDVYTKMKNKIIYGSHPDSSYRNKGKRSIMR